MPFIVGIAEMVIQTDSIPYIRQNVNKIVFFLSEINNLFGKCKTVLRDDENVYAKSFPTVYLLYLCTMRSIWVFFHYTYFHNLIHVWLLNNRTASTISQLNRNYLIRIGSMCSFSFPSYSTHMGTINFDGKWS